MERAGFAEAMRRQQDEQPQETGRCRNLLTNLVVVWNAVCRHEVVTQLPRVKQALATEYLRFRPSARDQHINSLGRYAFLPDETA